jgi:hypothetical protein
MGCTRACYAQKNVSILTATSLWIIIHLMNLLHLRYFFGTMGLHVMLIWDDELTVEVI